MAKTKAELLAEKMAKNRVGQSAFEAGKEPAVETQLPEQPENHTETAQETKKEVKPTANTSKPKKPVQANSEPSTDMLDKIIGKKKKKAKKITISSYGDEALIKKLDEVAAERGISRSEFINRLLTEVLKNT